MLTNQLKNAIRYYFVDQCPENYRHEYELYLEDMNQDACDGAFLAFLEHMMNKACCSGYAACHARYKKYVPLSSNPYHPVSQKVANLAWKEGWLYAYRGDKY